MKKLKALNTKFLLVLLAFIMPMLITGSIGSVLNLRNAVAEINYATSYIEKVNSLTNPNFNYSSVTTISSSPSGWTRQVSDNTTTAGIINVDITNFANNKANRYYLANNPGHFASTDKQILMINSKTSTDNTNKNLNTYGNEGYVSGSITLDTNSYYSFQVSMKSDTTYDTKTTYLTQGTTGTVSEIKQKDFSAAEFGTEENPEYVSFTFNNKTYFAKKILSDTIGTLTADTTSNKAFYADTTYVGILTDNTNKDSGVFVKLADASSIEIAKSTKLYINTDFSSTVTLESILKDEDKTADTLASNKFVSGYEVYDADSQYLKFEYNGNTCYILKTEVNYVFASGTTTYTAENITFDPEVSTTDPTTTYKTTTGVYKLANTQYYKQSTESVGLNQYGLGSIYLNLKDTDNEINNTLSYDLITTREWSTFYFFVSTGDVKPNASIELWLGDRDRNGSSGVVFFDNIEVYKYSPNLFYSRYQDYKATKNLEIKRFEKAPDNSITYLDPEVISQVKFVSYEKDNTIALPADFNFDFEQNDAVDNLNGWTRSEESTGGARIINLASPDEFEYTGCAYTGTNFLAKGILDSNGNLTGVVEGSKALALFADNQFIEVSSKDIAIDCHQIYKITAYYKTSDLNGTAFIILKENDNVLGAYNIPQDKYTLSSQSISITDNATNNFCNNYGKAEFYVKGSNLYNSSINIVLSLGNNDTHATGCVVFDDITIEYASSKDFENATNKLTLNANSAELSISNGYFNGTENTNENYPLTPSAWTIENSGLAFGGVINVKDSEYQKYTNKYTENIALGSDNPYLWATYANPGNAKGLTNKNDNILMLCNWNVNTQTVTSPSFKLSANKYYTLSYDYKTISKASAAEFSFEVYDSNNILLYSAESLSSELVWAHNEINFQTSTGAEEVHIIINFKNAEGFAYFDNFEIEAKDEMNEADVDVDMTNFYLKLESNTITNRVRDFKSYAYTTSQNSDNSNGGIVKSSYKSTQQDANGEDHEVTLPTYGEDSPFYVADEDLYMFVITNNKVGTYTIQSNYTIDLAENTYYKLSFKLKTHFNYQNSSYIEEHPDFKTSDYSYGVNVGINADGKLEYMKDLVCNDKYETYTLYINSTETTSGKLYISLTSDNIATTGTMVLYDLDLATFSDSDEDAWDSYQAALEAGKESNFDINTSKTFTTSQTEQKDEDNTETPNEDNNTKLGWEVLMYTSTIIFAVAMIVAIVGFFLRKVKIKKIEKKRKETYDRKGSLHKDVLRKEAEDQRNREAVELQENINKFEAELASVEKEHKEKVVALRKANDEKATEKEFKAFAQKQTVMTEKLNSLKRQLENVNSPEYLLNLERKKYLEDEAKQRLLKKESKKKSK